MARFRTKQKVYHGQNGICLVVNKNTNSSRIVLATIAGSLTTRRLWRNCIISHMPELASASRNELLDYVFLPTPQLPAHITSYRTSDKPSQLPLRHWLVTVDHSRLLYHPSYPQPSSSFATTHHADRLLQEEKRRAGRTPQSALAPTHGQERRAHRAPPRIRRQSRCTYQRRTYKDHRPSC